MEAIVGALDINAVTTHYRALARMVPLKALTSANDYRKAVAALEALLDAGGANEHHALAGLVEALGEVIESYEARVHRLPKGKPHEALAFLMQQHGLKQSDLSDIAAQGTISAVLSGKRGISKRLAVKLGERFGVSSAVFV
jgi:HTH-type transcriptional regulator/antitoxin HigA